jgi:hypothetical protein
MDKMEYLLYLFQMIQNYYLLEDMMDQSFYGKLMQVYKFNLRKNTFKVKLKNKGKRINMLI